MREPVAYQRRTARLIYLYWIYHWKINIDNYLKIQRWEKPTLKNPLNGNPTQLNKDIITDWQNNYHDDSTFLPFPKPLPLRTWRSGYAEKEKNEAKSNSA